MSRRNCLSRRFDGRHVAVQALEPRRMLCYADGGVVQHIGSRSHPAPNAAQLLQEAVIPVAEQVIVPGKDDPSKPSLSDNTRALPGSLLFSSRPGAPVTLFIDFDGQGETTFADGFLGFGGYDVPATPAYDIDGNPGAFSTTEAQNIERMWSIVAEKFSPLDVNVTTIDPGQSSSSCRVVVGGNGSWYGKGGGVAVEDGFFNDGFLWSADDTAYVWRDPTVPDSMGEAIAHEAGHLFGLKHNSDKDFYGNITTEYRPGWIMGEGYNPGGPAGRWDINQTSSYVEDGDIKNAGLQSDIATMISEAGLRRRADDHSGNVFVAPTPLAITANGRAGTGVHEIEGDMDYFTFTTSGGFISITVTPAPFQAMNNLTLEVWGFTTIDTASASETWSPPNTMPAGTYTIGVKSRGQIGDLGQYSIGVTLNEQFNNTMRSATPVGRFGELPGTFGLLNPVYAGRGIINDFVGNTDTEDYYRIYTDNLVTRQTVWMYGMSQDADVRIIVDRNRNLQVDSGEVLALSQASGNANEGFTVDLAPNTYYFIHVYRYQTANTNYTLELRADSAGEGPVNAGLPPRGPAIYSGETAYYDQVDEFERRDVFRVRPEYPGYLDLTLTGMTADADLRVALDLNNNGILESGETLYQSSLGGTNNEALYDIEVNPAWNLYGGYYVMVDYWSGSVTNYRLGVHLDTSSSYNVNNLTHPWIRGLGDLSTNNFRSFSEYIGSQDPYDIYSFTAPAGLLSIRSGGSAHYRDLVRDLNGNGVVDAGEIVAGGTNFDYTVPGAVGTSVPLFLRVQRSGGEFPTDGNYSQRIASQISLPTSDNTFGTARPVSLNTNLQRLSGYLQSASSATEFNDLEDYYKFTLTSAQRTRFSLAGVSYRSAGARGSGLPLAGLQLIRDANANGVLDANERLAGQGIYSARRSTQLETALEPGTYFVRVFVERPERPDEQSSARTNYTLDFQLVAPVEDPAPAVLSSSFLFETGPTGLSVTFSEDVSGTLTRDDVIVTDGNGSAVPLGEMFYDPATHVAYFSFVTAANPTGLLPEGDYTVTIDGSANLRDEAGIALESTFNGNFHVLLGDANRDRSVNFDDLLVLAQNYDAAGTFSQGDFDYDGTVEFDDLLLLAQRYGNAFAADWERARAGNAGTVADSLTLEPLFTTRSSRRFLDELL